MFEGLLLALPALHLSLVPVAPDTTSPILENSSSRCEGLIAGNWPSELCSTLISALENLNSTWPQFCHLYEWARSWLLPPHSPIT